MPLQGGLCMTNIPVDWKVFEYKFSQDPMSAFEKLATTLFCYEMGLSKGVFRYFNQPYIETQPVMSSDGLLTGFQAKYYDASTSLSSKKAELEQAITGAKKKYPGIQRILFYLNKEMSASTSSGTQKPKYQNEVEKHGQKLGIIVEWRVPSHIEQILVELPIVRDLYFNAAPGIDQWVEHIKSRSNSILFNIQSVITYQGEQIKIHRDMEKLSELWETKKSAYIIYGDAGTGKSGVVKDLIMHQQKQGDEPACFIFSSTDLDVNEESLFLHKYGHYQLEDLFSIYSQEKQKICIIESAEKFFSLSNSQSFSAIIQNFISHNWKIVFTIRTAYKDSFCSTVLENIDYDELHIDCITDADLEAISNQHHFPIPESQKIRSLLLNLFYLNLYLKLDLSHINLLSTEKIFFQKVWDEVICNNRHRIKHLQVRRGAMAEQIVYFMLQHESSIYKSSATDDQDALIALENDGIIAVYDNTPDQWMMSHDVYEELIVKHILNQRYHEGIKAENVLEGFGLSLRARKLYRIWLESIFSGEENHYESFLLSVLQSGLNQVWKDETLIALMQSGQIKCFQAIDTALSQDNYQLFTRMVFLLNTACRNIDQELLRRMPSLVDRKYRFTYPVGQAWHTVFRYIYNNRSLIPWTTQNLSIVGNTLKTWTDKNKNGDTTRLAGTVALYLKNIQWESNQYHNSLQRDTLFITLTDVILAASIELKQELVAIFQSVEDAVLCSEKENENYLLLKKSVSNIFDCGNIPLAIPQQVLQFAEHYWFHLPKKENIYDFFNNYDNMEDAFGLSHNVDTSYYPESAFQTPTLLLLKIAPSQTIDMILRIMNYATECYKNSELAKKYSECCQIDLHFSDGATQQQVCSDRLWNMHRGTSVSPNLLSSILMALEKWLLNLVESDDGEKSCQLCEDLLRRSRTVSITAVVLSAVLANPDKLFPISCILLKTKEIFLLDKSRLVGEFTTNALSRAVLSHRQFAEERSNSNALPFRKKSFEKVLMDYQIKITNLSKDQCDQRKAQLHAAFDDATQNIDSWEEEYRFAYYQSDLRKCQIKCEPVSQNCMQLSIEPIMPEALVNFRTKYQNAQKNVMRHTPLIIWANASLGGDSKAVQGYSQFDENTGLVIQEVRQILEEHHEDLTLDYLGAINACSVLVQKKHSVMNAEDLAFCTDVLLSAGLTLLKQKGHTDSHKMNCISFALASLVANDSLTPNWSCPLFMLFALVMYDSKQDEALNSVTSVLWISSPTAALKLMYAYAVLIPKYASEVYRYNGISSKTFFEKNYKEIENIFKTNVCQLKEIPLDGLEIYQLISLQRMLPSNHVDGSFDFVLEIGTRVWNVVFDSDNKDKNTYRNYGGEYAYINWLGDYVLNLSIPELNHILEKLMPCVKYERMFSGFLGGIICWEDANPRYDTFWELWNLLKNYILSAYDHAYQTGQLATKGHDIDHGIGEMLAEYLLAGPRWKKGVTAWHSLHGENAIFYKTIVNRMGSHPAILYSIGRLLNGIGTDTFFENGVEWLSDIVSRNPHLHQVTLPTNTIYYIEEYMYRYVHKKLYAFKSDPLRKHQVINVLNFLVDSGSSFGFLLREELI